MNKKSKRLTLSRDTVRALAAPALGEVAAGGVTQTCPCNPTQPCTLYITCGGSCIYTCDLNVGTCFFCG